MADHGSPSQPISSADLLVTADLKSILPRHIFLWLYNDHVTVFVCILRECT